MVYLFQAFVAPGVFFDRFFDILFAKISGHRLIFCKKWPFGGPRSSKNLSFGGLGGTLAGLGAPGGQKRGSWGVWAPILVTMLQERTFLGPKRGPMGSPRLPKWDQHGSEIRPKIVPKST